MKKKDKLINSIENAQIKILNKVKKKIHNQKKNGIDMSLSNLGFFSTYGQSPGKFLLYFWLKKMNIFQIFLNFLKIIFSITSLHNYHIVNFKDQKFDNLIISWGKFKNFNDGSYKDDFLNYNSHNLKNSLIFVISLDHKYPKKIPENVIIFLKKNDSRSLLFLFKNLILFLKENLFNLKSFLHYFAYNPIYSKILFKNLEKILKKNRLKKLILPYEGQTSQNYLIKQIKKKNKNCNTIGIAHAMIPALPLNFIRRDGAPDKLYLTGIDQKRLFVKRLGWKNKEVFLIPSLRLKKQRNKEIKKNIFLPIYVEDPKKVTEIFKNLFLKSETNYTNLVIRNHPQSNKIKNNIFLMDKLKKFILQQGQRNNKIKNNDNIYIGSTSAFIENLVKGLKALHISYNPILECYTNKFWPSLELTSQIKDVFRYKLKKKENLILLSEKKYNLLNTKII